MVDKRITELPLATGPTAPLPTDSIALDGITTRRAPFSAISDVINPPASQAEAEAGINAVKRMTPLTVKQSIASEIGASIASAAQGLLASTALQPANLINTPLTGQTTLEKTKNGNIQNLWSDGVNYQIVSDIKGTSFEKEFLDYGSWITPATSEEPAVREQYVTAHSVYDYSAGTYKGMTRPIYVMGRAQQHVIKKEAFDKIAGDFVEMHDKGPNRGEHFARVTHLYQHADRADPNINDPVNGGFFPVGGVADSWAEFIMLCDNGYNANGFGVETDMRNENRVRGETSPLNSFSSLFPQTGFQVNQTYSTDFSQYHITRAIAIVPSNAYGVTVGQPNLMVGFHTGMYLSGYANYGVVFGPSIAYNNPQNTAGTQTSPVAIVFANDDTNIMSFHSGGTAKWTMVRQSANTLGFVRNSDGKHFFLMDEPSGRLFMGNGNASIDMNGVLSVPSLTSVVNSGREANTSYASIIVSSGGTTAAPDTLRRLIVNSAGAIASYTVSLPANPVDGQEFSLTTTINVTTLNLNPGNVPHPIANKPTTSTAGQVFAWIFVSAAGAWYPTS